MQILQIVSKGSSVVGRMVVGQYHQDRRRGCCSNKFLFGGGSIAGGCSIV